MRLARDARVAKPSTYKDACKKDFKACGIASDIWENFAEDRNAWIQSLHRGIEAGEARRSEKVTQKRSMQAPFGAYRATRTTIPHWPA
ncbi:hypothetical protein DPMN_085549 [Dreissena polymorpha]|uniref:Uncharacterized protein n=1 Tax=Dreissena polymorpha TaxID=45954 RepID=A0A9D4BKE1_DREPO|nr:hypothetical protein DPMN_085549 [Dreissena polymorpha]